VNATKLDDVFRKARSFRRVNFVDAVLNFSPWPHHEFAFLCTEARALKNLARKTVNRRPRVSGNQWGFLSSAATMRLVLVITFSVCVVVSAAEFSLNATQVLFEGAVDGSAGADVGGGFFVGATDEDNKFRLYDVKGGPSLKTLDVGVNAAVKSALGLKKIKECDLEGAAKIADLIFWIGSHGRNEHAKEKKEWQVLFATKLTGVGRAAKLEIAGEVYTQLVDDLLKDSTLAPFDLAKAATLAPKAEGGLNIESLATDRGKLWIGFRNPQSKAKDALLVPLLNPTEIIKKGARAKLGDPLLLNLGGLGVRDMVAWNDGFLIIGGVSLIDSHRARSPRAFFRGSPALSQRTSGLISAISIRRQS